MKIFTCDAFTEVQFGGNPAGVLVIPEGSDYPDDETMRKLASELRYSETAFIKILGENDFQIRYFAPASEVDLCGHATIASFTCLKKLGLVKDNSKARAHTLAGDLDIDLIDGYILMDMATPKKLGEISEGHALKELYTIMGLDFKKHCLSGLKLLPEMISTGLPDIMMPVSSLEELNNIKPNFAQLSELSKKYNVVGVHAFTLDKLDDSETCHVRNFAPLYEIDEEAATGTSNGALTYYGYLHGFIKPGENNKFIQGEKMNRPSAILSRLTVDSGEVKIKVGGTAVIIIEGEIDLK